MQAPNTLPVTQRLGYGRGVSRYFLAIRPDKRARQHLKRALLARLGADTRLLPTARWHVTVAFLGPSPYPPKRLAARVEQLVVHRQMDEVRLRTSGSFGTACWVGLRPQHAVGQLHHQLLSLTAAPDQEFTPHVTVARMRHPGQRQRFRQLMSNYRGPRWLPTDLELVRSTLGAEVQHTTVAIIPLWRPH